MEFTSEANGIIQQRRQHAADLRATVLGLNAGQNQVVMTLLHEGLQDGGDAFAVRSVEGLIGEQHALVGAHRHLTAQHFFVILAAYRGDGDVAAGLRNDLQRLFDGVVVRLRSPNRPGRHVRCRFRRC